ncbi:hypothetical protein DRN32_01770 [Thermococci archaeon]|nr:MAG: hypothetical protein DRN32_01770 [Thermococci archaeon]RLI16665.1 MAG: hypothetical protein DRO41_01015 [Candidatus Bathyarchaeota archaeon]
MRIGFRKFGVGPGRDIVEVEVPQNVLLLINGQPRVVVEDLGDIPTPKLNKLVRRRSTLVSGMDLGFIIVKYRHMVEMDLVQPSGWIDPNDTEILLTFIKDDERTHVVWLHSHWE